jgi:hypothetical protein
MDPKLRLIAQWAALLGGIVFAGTYVIGAAVSMMVDPRLYAKALEQMPATIGLPSAALAALCLVIVMENTSGPIKFEGLGFKFEGASGPIILWCIVFLCMTGAIKLVWLNG